MKSGAKRATSGPSVSSRGGPTPGPPGKLRWGGPGCRCLCAVWLRVPVRRLGIHRRCDPSAPVGGLVGGRLHSDRSGRGRGEAGGPVAVSVEGRVGGGGGGGGGAAVGLRVGRQQRWGQRARRVLPHPRPRPRRRPRHSRGVAQRPQARIDAGPRPLLGEGAGSGDGGSWWRAWWRDSVGAPVRAASASASSVMERHGSRRWGLTVECSQSHRGWRRPPPPAKKKCIRLRAPAPRVQQLNSQRCGDND